MPKGLCIFCGKRADSTEDILPKWMQPLIMALVPPGARTISVIVDAAHPDGPQTLHRWTAEKPEVLTNDVCQQCNNQWMSNIERAAKPIVTRLMAGERSTLSLTEQHAVARWLALKGVLSLHVRVGEDASREWVQKFYADRDTPQDWHVRLGMVRPPELQRFSAAMITLTEHYRLGPFPIPYTGIVCAIVAGHFVGQVIAFKGRPESIRLNAEYYVPIWPRAEVENRVGERIDREFNVRWPPKRALNHAQLQKALANYLDPLE